MTTIALIGAPGAGKSTIGPRLAAALGLTFVDVDAEIEHRAGREIADIFATEGEQYFRELEHDETLRQLASGGVVALGGGAVMTPGIREALADHTVVWLQVSAGAAADRAGLNVARPLLLGNVRGRLRALLAERLPVYEALADITVDTEVFDVDQVVEAVMAELGAT